MTAVNVRHVGIVTTNLKESLNFYKKILGFKIVKKMKETDRSLSNIMALKNTKVTTVKMRSKDSGMINVKNVVFCSRYLTLSVSFIKKLKYLLFFEQFYN